MKRGNAGLEIDDSAYEDGPPPMYGVYVGVVLGVILWTVILLGGSMIVAACVSLLNG